MKLTLLVLLAAGCAGFGSFAKQPQDEKQIQIENGKMTGPALKRALRAMYAPEEAVARESRSSSGSKFTFNVNVDVKAKPNERERESRSGGMPPPEFVDGEMPSDPDFEEHLENAQIEVQPVEMTTYLKQQGRHLNSRINFAPEGTVPEKDSVVFVMNEDASYDPSEDPVAAGPSFSICTNVLEDEPECNSLTPFEIEALLPVDGADDNEVWENGQAEHGRRLMTLLESGLTAGACTAYCAQGVFFMGAGTSLIVQGSLWVIITILDGIRSHREKCRMDCCYWTFLHCPWGSHPACNTLPQKYTYTCPRATCQVHRRRRSGGGCNHPGSCNPALGTCPHGTDNSRCCGSGCPDCGWATGLTGAAKNGFENIVNEWDEHTRRRNVHRTSTPCSEFNDCAISGTNQASAFGTITHAAGTAIGAYCPYGKLGCDTPHGASSLCRRASPTSPP